MQGEISKLRGKNGAGKLVRKSRLLACFCVRKQILGANMKFQSKGKVLVLMAVIIFLPSLVFAYDGTAWGGYDGNFTRYSYIQQASDINLARDALRGRFGNNIRIDKLFSIGEDEVDPEDVEMIRNQETFILRNFRVANGDAFSYAVKRGDVGEGIDGWIIFSHYSSTQGWLHYLYYFLIY